MQLNIYFYFRSRCSINTNKVSFNRTLRFSLPNVTVIKFTVHYQTQLQSKFKGTFDSCLFPTVLRTQIFVLYYKMFRGHNNIVNGRLRNFLYKNGLYKTVCNSIRFCKRQNIENMSKGMTYRMRLALQLLYIDLFLMKQYNIRVNPYV